MNVRERQECKYAGGFCPTLVSICLEASPSLHCRISKQALCLDRSRGDVSGQYVEVMHQRSDVQILRTE